MVCCVDFKFQHKFSELSTLNAHFIFIINRDYIFRYFIEFICSFFSLSRYFDFIHLNIMQFRLFVFFFGLSVCTLHTEGGRQLQRSYRLNRLMRTMVNTVHWTDHVFPFSFHFVCVCVSLLLMLCVRTN